MKKFFKLGKRMLALFSIAIMVLLNINSYAAVGANDGSAFVTKAEFDALVNTFNDQMDTYQSGLNAKIDGAIANYLAGLSGISTTTEVAYFIRNASGNNITMRANNEYPFKINTNSYTYNITYSADFSKQISNVWHIYAKIAELTLSNNGTEDGTRIMVKKLSDNRYMYNHYATGYKESWEIAWSRTAQLTDDGFEDGAQYVYPLYYIPTTNDAIEELTGSLLSNRFSTNIIYVLNYASMKSPTSTPISSVKMNDYTKERPYDAIFSNNDDTTYVYAFDVDNSSKIISGKNWSDTNDTLFDKQSMSGASYWFLHVNGTTSVWANGTRQLTKRSASEYTGMTNKGGKKYVFSLAPIAYDKDNKVGSYWGDILYPDSNTYEYKYQASAGSSVSNKKLYGYSMVAGLPLVNVEAGTEIRWTYAFTNALDGRKLYIKYGEFDGNTIESDDIKAFDASEKSKEIVFKADKADMLFVKWTTGNTLDVSNSSVVTKNVES